MLGDKMNYFYTPYNLNYTQNTKIPMEFGVHRRTLSPQVQDMNKVGTFKYLCKAVTNSKTYSLHLYIIHNYASKFWSYKHFLYR